ncbi:MAG TPA: DUF1015 domain-containing protein [Candidatus Dormibacteraeota bacterium]
MADVRPFRGVTYDPSRVDLADVLCPPYDVISPSQQQAYYGREAHNAVRIVLNRAEGDARYAEAAGELQRWLAEGVLRRGGAPAYYVHRQTFGGTSRIGVITAVRLQPWTEGAVRPHEHTMPGPKQDRLQLMRATAADTEPIWCFHPDPDGEVGAVLNAIIAEEPGLLAKFVPVPGIDGSASPELHELWTIEYAGTLERIRRALNAVQLYIADGHHRYETALHHAAEVGGGPDEATRFKLMLLSSVDDPGLLVLPTHRLVRLPAGHSLGALLAALQGQGWLTEQFSTAPELQARLGPPAAPGMLGFGLFADGRFSYLEGPVDAAAVATLAPSLASLDVALLQEGVLRSLLGIGEVELAEGRLVAYSRDAEEVLGRVRAGEFDLGILVRPPSLAQVQAVADAGENMPQKSTYFWPKPASGLLMMLQPRGELL